MIKGLYIHIPFCKRICIYCDFCKMVAPKQLQNEYLDALKKELNQYKDKYYNLETIYIGGGTPSSLNSKVLESLLIELNNLIKISTIKEFTIEANVSDISDAFLKLIKSYGVNRLSIGVQSTSDQLLELMHRDHIKSDIYKVNSLLKKHHFTNYNFDFIHSIPSQTKDDLLEDLKLIKELRPPHISYYSLIIEDRTELKYLIDKGNLQPIDDDKDYEYSLMVRNHLKKIGYANYETSNYCMNGFEAKHNLLYWNLEEYIGIGLSSASQYDNRRMKNTDLISKYLRQAKEGLFVPVEEDFDEEKEYIILGLRKTEGISLVVFKERFNKEMFKTYPVIEKHIENGLLNIENNQLYFTEKGKDLANQVYIDII